MISLFLGEVYRLTVRRRVWLVALGFGLAFVFNAGRTLLLAVIASARGVGAVASWHDPAGVTILVACFLSLWLIAQAFRKAESRNQKAEMGTAGPRTTGLKRETLKC
jgi:exosortase/archaeosortase family protein